LNEYIFRKFLILRKKRLSEGINLKFLPKSLSEVGKKMALKLLNEKTNTIFTLSRKSYPSQNYFIYTIIHSQQGCILH